MRNVTEQIMLRFCRQNPEGAAQLGVTMVLQAFLHAKTPDQREAIAAEIARLDGGSRVHQPRAGSPGVQRRPLAGVER